MKKLLLILSFFIITLPYILAEEPLNDVLIIAGSTTLNGNETNFKNLLESNQWVNMSIIGVVDDNDGNFSDYEGIIDAAIIFESANSGTIGNGLQNVSYGVISIGETMYDTELLLCGGTSGNTFTAIDLDDNSHYITSSFSIGSLTILDTIQSLNRCTSPASNVTLLSSAGGTKYTTGILDVGEYRTDNSQSPGRRAWVSWKSTYFDEWNSNGQEIAIKSSFWVSNNTVTLESSDAVDLWLLSAYFNISQYRNYSHPLNEYSLSGSMPMNFTIYNYGTNASGWFNYNLTINNTLICDGALNLSGKGNKTIGCDFPLSHGIHFGSFNIDPHNNVSEGDETHNSYSVFIPLETMYLHFTYDEWNNSIVPFNSNSSNTIGYNSYNNYINFASDRFQQNANCNLIDPRGKEGRKASMSCLINNYSISNTECDNAYNHTIGWSNRTPSSCTAVQNFHEYAQMGLGYDLMRPYLTQAQHDYATDGYQAIAQEIFSILRPDQDSQTGIAGGNGPGFGSGNGMLVYAIMGHDADNPLMLYDPGGHTVSMWDEYMKREQRYYYSFKNDSYSKYAEGWHYKLYSQFHLVENILFQKKHNLNDLDQFENAFCSMSREMITEFLDDNYNGQDLRNDENRIFRFVQRGDSNSYDSIDSDSVLDFGMVTYYGAICDDPDVIGSIAYMREYMANQSSRTANTVHRSLVDTYLQYFVNQVTILHPNDAMPKFMYDNANDIATWRDGYTYDTDTVFQVDAGEERGLGHPHAQGYYLYALGEPFLDYEQYAYEDDTRPEMFKNGISLENITFINEGEGSGFYSETCGAAPVNQYYGSNDCPIVPISSYPDYRKFDLNYGGDIEDYIGDGDGNYFSSYVWRPYENASEVLEYFIKHGDTIYKKTVVSNNNEGEIFHNFININDEFTQTIDGLNFTLESVNNSGNYLDTKLIYSSNPALTLQGGETNITYCYGLTSCSGTSRGLGKYRRLYYYLNSNALNMIHAHHWYTTGQNQEIIRINNGDKGAKQGNKYTLFDMGNNNITHGNRSVNGWGLVYDLSTTVIGAFNTTSINTGSIALFSSNDTMEAVIDRGSNSIVVWVNTMERQTAIDYPKTVNVVIDTQEIGITNYSVNRNNETSINVVDEGASKISFDVFGGQTPTFYQITADTGEELPAQNNTPGLPTQNNNLSDQLNTICVSTNTGLENTAVKIGSTMTILFSLFLLVILISILGLMPESFSVVFEKMNYSILLLFTIVMIFMSVLLTLGASTIATLVGCG